VLDAQRAGTFIHAVEGLGRRPLARHPRHVLHDGGEHVCGDLLARRVLGGRLRGVRARPLRQLLASRLPRFTVGLGFLYFLNCRKTG
jgi:hypothetical protein